MILKILWGALLASHFMYLFVLYTVNQSYEGEKGLEEPMLLPVMASGALCAWAAGFFLYKHFLATEKKKVRNPSQDEMASIYLTPMIVRLALFEAAAIMGFVPAFLSHDINYFLPPLLINIGLFAMNFPSEQRIKDAFLS
jgi:F0F1-type ATP synthase membrane subunit c/vacuolar-type H+-ATPase subunit K